MRNSSATARACHVEPSLDHRFGNIDLKRLGDAPAFPHHRYAHASQSGLFSNAIERRESKQADRVEAGVPPQLQPDVPAYVVAYRRVETRRGQCSCERLHTRRLASIRLTDREPVEFVMDDQTWGDHFAGRIHHAADGAFGPEGLPLTTAAIDRFEMAPLQLAAGLGEVPPRDAVESREDWGVRTQQGRESFALAPGLMSFQCADHDILRAKAPWFIAGRYPDGSFLTTNSQAQTILLDRFKVGATRDGADIIASERKLDREVTTDGSGTIHTDLHVTLISAKNPDALQQVRF
jgi:hypothetical protein